jgi:hypothetical protein
MSSFDVPPDEMGTDPQAADDAIDRMLSGGAPVDDEWRDFALFVQELQEAVPSSGLASQDLHVAAMVETARLLAEKGDPAVRPVSNAAAPAPQVSGLPKQRRKSMKRSTRTLIRVLAPIAAVLTVFSGMAYAGALPHTVQKAVSTAASTVGIDLPGDDEEQGDNDDQGEDTQGDDTTKDDSVTPVDETDDQGENDDNQGDNDNQGESDDSQGDTTDESAGDDQGENDDNQGDNDNQGEDTQGDETSGNDQGDEGGDSQSGDEQGSEGDQQGDSQD